MPSSVSVPQPDGEIVISLNGDPPTTYTVTKGVAEVPDDRVITFLTHVAGSQVVAPPKTPKEK